MVRFPAALLAVAVLAATRAAAAELAEPGPGPGPAPRLALRLRLDPGEGSGPLAVEPRRAKDTTPPACVADWCQMRVDVPGMSGPRGRPSRTELFVALLDRAQIEPLASVAWFFVVTGLRVDWSPANMDESFGATAGGWGNVFVRLRLRIDAFNRPTIPVRPKERMRRERELAAERERAREVERIRALVAPPSPAPAPPPIVQRPARLSST